MKVAVVIFVLALFAVPALSWRFREWTGSSCSGSTLSTSHTYKNKLGQCQPFWNSTTTYITLTSKCSKHQTTSVLFYSDSGCKTLIGGGVSVLGPNRGDLPSDPSFWYTSGGCQGNRADGSSWNIDCAEKM